MADDGNLYNRVVTAEDYLAYADELVPEFIETCDAGADAGFEDVKTKSAGRVALEELLGVFRKGGLGEMLFRAGCCLGGGRGSVLAT